MAACPSGEELSAFSRGALPLASLKHISQHVSVCAACDSKLSTLVDASQRSVPKTPSGPEQSPAGSAQVVDSTDRPLSEALVESSQPGDESQCGEAETAPLQLGQYRLLRQIGRGGMGVVYQAWHERLKRIVAVKFVPVDDVKSLIDAERLQREMAAVGTLRHPNIVYATDAGECEGVHYLVMEYVEGIDLAKLVSRVGPLAVADACEIIRQAAVGLECIEQQQLVHRDLKPSNLMLAADGTVKILDLGLARLRATEVDEELTQNGYLLGTIDFVAPEQARDARSADIRSDIYSLGCTFYKLLAGEPPFGNRKHSSVASKILAHERDRPPPLAEFREDVPPEVEAILTRMLAKEPDGRFQSAVQLRRALEPLAARADLKTLAAEAQIAAPAVSTAEAPTTSRAGVTPSDVMAPAPQAAPKRRFGAKLAIGIGIFLVLLAAIAIVRRPRQIVPQEIAYLPRAALGTSSVKEVPGGFELNSEQIQLVALGTLRPNARTFAVTIDQADGNWNAQFGIFFGYRILQGRALPPTKNPFNGTTGMFQLLHFDNAGTTVDPKSGNEIKAPALRVSRELAFIHPQFEMNPDLTRDYLHQQHSEIQIPTPERPAKLRVVIDFDGRRIARIRVNDIELKDLVGDVNQHYGSEDYQGYMGLFNFGQRDTRFTDIDVSSLDLFERE